MEISEYSGVYEVHACERMTGITGAGLRESTGVSPTLLPATRQRLEVKRAETDRHEEYPQALAGARLGQRCALGVPMASLPSTARGTNKAPLQAAQHLLVDELGQTTQPPWADFFL